jgi:hypothetical protein
LPTLAVGTNSGLRETWLWLHRRLKIHIWIHVGSSPKCHHWPSLSLVNCHLEVYTVHCPPFSVQFSENASADQQIPEDLWSTYGGFLKWGYSIVRLSHLKLYGALKHIESSMVFFRVQYVEKLPEIICIQDLI